MSETRREHLVIVTGGTKGLGRALSLTFGRASYEVIALFHEDDEAAAALNADFERNGIAGRCVKHDVTSGPAPVGPDDRPLTVVHSACAYFEPRPLHLVQWDEFERSYLVAVKGAFEVLAAVRPAMIKRGGTFITILSAALESNPRGFAAYLTAKAALRAFQGAIAAEYADRGLRVFSVSPPFMSTPLTDRWPPALRAKVAASGTMSPLEVAARVLQLANAPDTPARGEDYLVGPG